MDRLVDAKYVVTGADTVSLRVFCLVRWNANAGTCGGSTVNEGTADPSRSWFYCLSRLNILVLP